MSCLTNPDLLKLLAFPECGGALIEAANSLNCSQCSAHYEIREGIPLLYPVETDRAHLLEEENLARQMEMKTLDVKYEFGLSQWHLSKMDFWTVVENNIKKSPAIFANLGCGGDDRFRQFENGGNIFINFDLVYKLLYGLQTKNGAKSCVGGDVNKMPFKKGIFDYIISIDLLHHESQNMDAILQSFRDLLTSDGLLFLEDPNAWGIFQMGKSIFLPRPVYQLLRNIYHRVGRSIHKPADYEFPTNVWKVIRTLRKKGFKDIRIHAQNTYPGLSGGRLKVYQIFAKVEYIRKFHNYHYMISASKGT